MSDSGSVAGEHIEQLLRDERLLVSTTVGISMWPMLRNRRDTIVVRPLRPHARLAVGDAPLYTTEDPTRGKRYVLHRVVDVHDGWYSIRGDNCLLTEHVRDDQILGRLEEFYRGSRHVVVDSSHAYRLYWHIWLALWPIRCCWKVIRAAAGRFLRHLGWKGLHPNRTF